MLNQNPVRETSGERAPVLKALAVEKSFGGIRALKGVSLDLLPAEVHALVGENGAGKSTLIKILTGALQPDGGAIVLGGERIENSSPSKARALGIGVVYQEPALFPDLTVAENIAFAKEEASAWRTVGWKAMNRRAVELLARVGARIRPDALAGSLNMPEQQLVEIAKALDAERKVLILDEPTASLGDEETENLFRIIAELKAGGTAVLYISHRLKELFVLADRVTVLRDGNSIATQRMAQTTQEELIRLMVGRELASVFPRHAAVPGEVALEVRNISCKQLGVNNVSLTIRRGEVLGLAGLVGSGRTQVAEALFGLARLDEGEIFIDGQRMQMQSPAEAVRAGLAYVPEDRRRHGVILAMSIAMNITLASLDQVSTRGFLQFLEEQSRARGFVGDLGVKTSSIDTPVRSLSGGNQQKVALARWLMTNPKVLMLDEPTQGIDVGAKFEIYSLIGKLAERGLCILLISSEMPEILALSDRVAVMAGGTIAAVLEREEATPYAVLELALGHGRVS